MPYNSLEKRRENSRRWNEANPGKLKEMARATYLKHRDKRLKEGKERYQKNIERERERSRRRRAEEPGQVAKSRRKYELRIKYDLTESQFNAMLQEQSYCCANKACGATSSGVSGRKFHIDHDHKTGKVRGLLCMRCNLLIGYAKDDIEILSSAIDYLINQKGKGNEENHS